MAGVLIENGGSLSGILRLLGAADWDCRWLLTGLEVIDCTESRNWEEPLLLSNRELLLRAEEVQFIWGILSAFPASCTEEQILAERLPAFTVDENGESCYLADTLLPQHPLAFLEIMSEDRTSVTVVGPDMAPLRPLFRLPEWTEDAEAYNRRWHELLHKGAAVLDHCGLEREVRRYLPEVGQEVVNDRLAPVWWALYRHHPERPIRQEDIQAELLRQAERGSGHGGS